MNRKVLAVLFLCPVAFFATNKMIGMAGTTSKTTEKTTQDTYVVNNNFVSSEEVISEMKESIKDRKGRQKAYRESKYVGLWSDKLNEVQTNFLKASVVKPLEKNNICTINLERSFSRCPSGYDAVVITKDNQLTNEGWLICRSGCDDNPITMFRFDVIAKTAEAKVSDRIGYISLDEYFKVYKTASADL